jgi:hypothetical protein
MPLEALEKIAEGAASGHSPTGSSDWANGTSTSPF